MFHQIPAAIVEDRLCEYTSAFVVYFEVMFNLYFCMVLKLFLKGKFYLQRELHYSMWYCNDRL